MSSHSWKQSLAPLQTFVGIQEQYCYLPSLILDLSPLADTSGRGDDDLAGSVEHILHLVNAQLQFHVRQDEVGVQDEDNIPALLLVLEVHLGLLNWSLTHHGVEVLGQQTEGCSDQ